MATIRKRTGPRGVRYSVLVRKPGQPTQSRTFSTKKLAEAWARGIERSVDEGVALPHAVARRRTVSDALDLAMASDTGRDNSRAERMDWWRERLGDRKLVDITKGVISEALHELETVPSDKTGGLRKPGTINRYLTTLSAALREAERRDWIPSNPARKVGRRKERNTRHRYLSDDERKALLEAARAPEAPTWLYPLVITALGTGARRGELLALRWADVDLVARRARLADTKSDEPRTLVLLPPVVAALRDLGRVRDIHDDRVFQLRSQYALDKPWREAVARAGVEDFRFHDLRHACASYMAGHGANLPTIMQALGHTTLAATQRYQHLLVDHVEDALEKALDGKLS